MGLVFNFSYVDHAQDLYLKRGIYLFECWGASGGSKQGKGGKGSYVSGLISVFKGRYFFIYVGQKGSADEIGQIFNGGGSQGPSENSDSYGGSGGGASDIRLIGGEWDVNKGLDSRIIVAAGGGGVSNYKSTETRGGNGGTFEGESAGYSQCSKCPNSEAETYFNALGGNQTDGGCSGGSNNSYGKDGEFGKGGDSYDFKFGGGGGGGGYYGGGGGGQSNHRIGAGAGGSSFVSGMKGCIAKSHRQDNPSIHKSGFYFSNPIMKGGNEAFLNPLGTITTGNDGDGYVRISFVSELLCSIPNNFLISSKSILTLINVFIFLSS